jgi:hypothetical protein
MCLLVGFHLRRVGGKQPPAAKLWVSAHKLEPIFTTLFVLETS